MSILRHSIVATLFAAVLALPAAAEDAHHPPADSAQPRAGQPDRPDMMGNMMQMMRQMMAGMMQDRGAMQRMRMMGMSGTGMMGNMQARMGARAVEHVEGHIAFLKAELKITATQAKAWDDYAAVLQANAKQLNELAAELAKAPAKSPAEASPVDRLAMQEAMLAARLETVRRTKPALAALVAVLSDEQKKTFQQFSAPRMGMR